MITIKAGCILINMETKRIALVCRKGEFSFPKGHLEEGEKIEECAIRETIEDTGHECHLIKEIAKINYSNPSGEDVENYFFIAMDDGVSKKHINENDKEETIWKDFSEIENTLSYENLIELWNNIKNEVKEIIDNG